MKRIIMPLAVLGAAVLSACGDTGPGVSQPGLLERSTGPQSASERPVSNEDQADWNADQPAIETEQADPSETQSLPGSPGGGALDCAGLCAGIAADCNGGHETCQQECNSFSQAIQYNICASEVMAFYDCVVDNGVVCDENDYVVEVCFDDAEVLVDCFRAQNPEPDPNPDQNNNFFPCQDGSREIPVEFLCDGDLDCDDGSDEIACAR